MCPEGQVHDLEDKSLASRTWRSVRGLGHIGLGLGLGNQVLANDTAFPDLGAASPRPHIVVEVHRAELQSVCPPRGVTGVIESVSGVAVVTSHLSMTLARPHVTRRRPRRNHCWTTNN